MTAPTPIDPPPAPQDPGQGPTPVPTRAARPEHPTHPTHPHDDAPLTGEVAEDESA